jgi:hypothetical protein
MKKKKRLFDNISQEFGKAPPPWTPLFNALFMLPPGDQIEIPCTREYFVKAQKDLSTMTATMAPEALQYIEFLFKQESLGNLCFAEEPI